MSFGIGEQQVAENTVIYRLMKKLFVIASLMSILFSSSWAQEQEKNVSALKAEIASLQSKLEDQEKNEQKVTSQIAGFGKEFGTAMNGLVEAMDGGLKVTTDRVNEFAKTDVGKYAVIAISWKIFSADIISIGESVFAKILGFILLFVFCWVLKRTLETLCWGKMIVVKKEGPWYAVCKTKERTVPLVKDDDIDVNTKWTYVTISCVVMFILMCGSCTALFD